MKVQTALRRIERGYGGVEEATAVRDALQEVAAWAHEGIMALLDHDLPRIGLQLKRIQALAKVDTEEEGDD